MGADTPQYKDDHGENDYYTYSISPTKGVRVFPFVVGDDVVEEYETHTKITMGGEQWSLLTVPRSLRTGDYKTKNVTIPPFPYVGDNAQQVYFVYWSAVQPLINHSEAYYLGIGHSKENAAKYSYFSQHRHKDLLRAHEEGIHLFFILLETQFPGFNKTMKSIGLFDKVKSLGDPVANLNYSGKFNPRLHLFYMEGKSHV